MLGFPLAQSSVHETPTFTPRTLQLTVSALGLGPASEGLSSVPVRYERFKVERT